MPQLVLVRHGQSVYNLENRFTGETDVLLTDKGREEAKLAGEKLKEYHFDACFTSLLKRAQETLHIILTETGNMELPVTADHALNERNYGQLQGLNKEETAKKFGDNQVTIWRRSYDIAPPGGESLKDTQNRVLPYYHEHIEPLLKQQKNVLVVAHGNSLRALIKHLDRASDDDIVELNIPTGVPLVYELDDATLEPIRHYYLE